MDDSEPTLPAQPELGQITHERPARLSLLTRKRTYDQSVCDDEPLTATSSDPALFSADEQDSAAENYASKRKKKMYTGSWWNHRTRARKADRRREFTRNYDSGIFMGSDSELLSSDSLNSLEDELVRDQEDTDLYRRGPSRTNAIVDIDATPRAPLKIQHSEKDVNITPRMRLAVKTKDPSNEDSYVIPTDVVQRQIALKIIRKCLDDGIETVDLSGQHLTEIPPEIRELASLTKQTNFVTGMLDSGTSLETQLRLFLGNNFLRALPVHILHLSNLRELSLRRNKLTRLPAGIRNLTKLEKLNIAGNKLTSLPFELIELMRDHQLRELTAEPNLWEVPHDLKVINMKGSLPYANDMAKESETLKGLYRASVPVVPSLLAANVPSLAEASLRQLLRMHPLDDLRDYMPLGTSVNVLRSLDLLNEAIHEGGRRCNVCQRTIVQPGQEWTEWWLAGTCYVPIKRMTCSSTCASKATGSYAAT